MNTHAVVCNDVDGTDLIGAGALCYVRQYSSENANVLVDVMNREGMWISLWRPYAALTNFRAKFIPKTHAKYIWAVPKSAAQAKVSALVGALSSAPARVNADLPTTE
jgi:hypothetical protein